MILEGLLTSDVKGGGLTTDGSVTERLVLFANSGCVFLYLCMFALVLQCIFVEKCI